MTTMSSCNPGTWRQRCDAHCHNARGPKCTCLCGGRYHGKREETGELQRAMEECGEEVLEAAAAIAAAHGARLKWATDFELFGVQLDFTQSQLAIKPAS